MIAMTLATLILAPSPHDTLRVGALARLPSVDGRIEVGEYGAPAVTLHTSGGLVRVWLGHRDGALFIAAEIPDGTRYWGDDLVVAIDPDGSGGPAPGSGDRLWILRRIADSSVAVVATGDGRWEPAGGARSIGAVHRGAGWTAATADSGARWVAELRVDLPNGTAAPRVAVRTFNDAPAPAWVAWPAPDGVPAQRVERMPDHWMPFVLGAPAGARP